MTVNAIRQYLDASPFKPVNLITSSGKSYLVPHPDFLTFSPAGRTCNVYAADGEYFTALDVLTITEVAPVKRRPAGKKKD
jgi:hypothetical protein